MLKAFERTQVNSPSDDVKQTNSDLEGTSSIRAADRNWRLMAVILGLVYLLGFIAFLEIFRDGIRKVEPSTYICIIATIVALALAITYYFAFRFYEDAFYLFVAIGWLFNAIYLPAALLFDKEKINRFEYLIAVHLLSLMSSIAFWLAVLFFSRRPITESKKKVTYIWFILLFLSIIFNIYNLVKHKPNQGGSEEGGFLLNAVVGSLFSAYVLFRLGTATKDRLDQGRYGGTLRWLSLSFYLYGVLQIAHMFELHLGDDLNLSLFGVAILIKVINIMALLRVLLSFTYPEFMESKRKLEMRSRLEELGAMAASIEHDLKTPLGTMNLSIKTMKERFQANTEVIKGLNKIEDARNRIAAIARVIPYLTGDKEYYDRDRLMRKTSILEIVHRAIRLVKQEMNIDTSKIFFDLSRKHLFIRAFSPMVEQVLVNVFKNSLEAIREAGKDRGVIGINISAVESADARSARWVKVEVSDNGRGIAPENIELVTTLFSDRGEKKPNSGIGLFIGSKLMDIHDGKIEVQSNLGEWTKVSLLFPEWEASQKLREEDRK